MIKEESGKLVFFSPEKIRIYPNQSIIINFGTLDNNKLVFVDLIKRLGLQTKIRVANHILQKEMKVVLTNFGKNKIILHEGEDILYGYFLNTGACVNEDN